MLDLEDEIKVLNFSPSVNAALLNKKVFFCEGCFSFRQIFIRINNKLDIENPIIRINTAFKGCSSLEKISVLPRIYHN